ncbi:MAG: glycosyltransferase [Paludibacteraceae bacterium]|nr:glycosyltransferase [Paludibacteraceae bacterium]
MGKIIFIQSFASPLGIMENSIIYKNIKNRYREVKLLSIVSDRGANLTKFQSLRLAIKAIVIAQSGDLIFGWGADVCYYAWVVNLLFRKKIRFLSQNLIIDKEKSSFFRFKLYKLALKSRNFYATVNSPGLIDYYASILNCDKNKLFLVYDSMKLDDYQVQNKYNSNSYIFFGGKAYRDVKTFVKVVKLLPNRPFVAVLKKDMVLPEMESLPNLKVYCDVDKNLFYDLLKNASLCFIPLLSMAPCGLFVMQHAALMNIPIVSTETYSMRTLVPSDEYGFLCSMGDYKMMAEKITEILNDVSLGQSIVSKAKSNMKMFSPENVSVQLLGAFNSVLS